MKTNSKSGMRSTENLKSQDICAIIKACKQASVTELRYRGLEIKFTGKDPSHLTADQRQIPEDVQVIEREATKPQEQKIITEDEEALKEMRNQQLMMDDPASFEQQIADSMLENAVEQGVHNAEANH